MEDWDAQKMLDLYIYDYLVRKNLHKVADTLAQEANIQPKSVVINPPKGFLSEWWSLFWDVHCSRTGIKRSSSTSAPPPEVPDINYMLQNICPPGFPNLQLQAANPTAVPMPETGSSPTVVPPGILHPTINAHNVEQFAFMQPSGSNSGSRRKRINNRRPSPLSEGVNLGTSLRRPTSSELASPVPRLILDSTVQQANAGSSASSNSSCPDAS